MSEQQIPQVSQEVNEEWRDVPGYEGYYSVSNLGNVRSYANRIWKGWERNRSKPHLIVAKKDRYGYLKVVFSVGNKMAYFTVHRLVLLAFIGPDTERPQVNHKNGDKVDNRLENLEWCDASSNLVHAINFLGRRIRMGNQCPQAKLSPSSALEAVRLCKAGMFQKDVARLLGVCKMTISNLVNGRIWTHVTGIHKAPM